MAIPSKPTNVSATRIDDNRIDISWTNHATSSSPYNSLVVCRGDGPYMEIATLSGSATSYSDTSSNIGMAFAYVLYAKNSSGESDFSSPSATIYGRPYAPSSISGARLNGTIVRITLANTASTATSTELQYSTDGTTWNDATSTQSRATTIDWDTGGGEFYFRARNARGDLKSDWSPVSEKVSALVPPLAPTLLLPSSCTVIPKGQNNITFSWQHNPADGSAQTAAELQYSTNGGTTWTTVSETTSQSASVANNFSVNATVTWRVRTKGADASYGPYSSTRTFTVRQVPTIAFVTSKPPAVVADMPIEYQLTYSDQSGSFSDGTVSITDANGNVVYSEAIASNLTGEISASEFIPTNGQTYRMVATVNSTSSLSSTIAVQMSVAFVEPQAGTLTIANNQDGTVGLVANYQSGGEITTTHNGTTTLTTIDEIQGEAEISEIKIYGSATRVNGTVKTTCGIGSGTGSSLTWPDLDVTQSDGGSVEHTYSDILDGNYVAGIGSVRDVATIGATGGEITHNIKCVDLGTLTWTKSNTLFTSTSLNDVKWSDSALLCGPYQYGGKETSTDPRIHIQGHIYKKYTGSSMLIDKASAIFVDDSNYSSAQAFKTAMSGVLMYYETTTPSTVILLLSREFEPIYPPTTEVTTNAVVHSDMTVKVVEEFPVIEYATVKRGDVVLGDNLSSGAAIFDKYAPLNTDYNYTIITHAESGAVKAADVANRIESKRFFVYWLNNIASGIWNFETSKAAARPERSMVRYAGRSLPVAYDSKAISKTRNISFVAVDKTEAGMFEQLMSDTGAGVIKTPDGEVMHAVFDMSEKPSSTTTDWYSEITLTATQVDGGEL